MKVVKYKCERCKSKLESDEHLAGLTDDCPLCGHLNKVPKTKNQIREEKRKQKELELTQLAAEAAVINKKREQAEKEDKEKCEKLQKQYEATLMSVKKESHLTKAWYCFIEGKKWGPMPEARLQAWISENRVKCSDKVHPEGIDIWLKLSDLPEIFTFAPPESSNTNSPCCPKCGSSHISANKKGVDATGACCGALLLGPLGLLCGVTDKVVVTCLKCGYQWQIG